MKHTDSPYASKRIVNTSEVQKTINHHSNTAKHFYLSLGNLKVLRVSDLHLWLSHVSDIPKVASIVIQISQPDISKQKYKSLLKQLMIFSDAAEYMESLDLPDGELSSEYAPWELLANQRVNVDQLEGDTQVVPAFYLLPAFENRDHFQFQLKYDLTKYGLDYFKQVDIDFYYFILENMDLPGSYQSEETIIPLAVYDDALKIAQRVAFEHFYFAHQAAKQMETVPIGDVDDSINDYADAWIRKYPILHGLALNHFQRHLLYSYTMVPSGIIREFGPDELCVPFDHKHFTKLTARSIDSYN